MADITKELLSGSTRGKPIKVVAIASPGTAIHSTGVSATIKDLITLKAFNSDTVNQTLTVEFGGTADPDDLIVKSVTIPPRLPGPIDLVIDQPLTGTGAAASNVNAVASAANVITITGYVNRVTP